MTPVRLEPAALRSRVKHSTTEPLRSLRKRKQIDLHNKHIYCIFFVSVVFLCHSFKHKDRLKCHLFGDINISINGNHDILKIHVQFKCVLLENQTCNYFDILLSIAIFYLLFIHVSFVKLYQFILSWNMF